MQTTSDAHLTTEPGLTEPPGDDRHGSWLTTRELVLLALVAAMVYLAKAFTHVPLHVAGHAGMAWIAVLVIGRGLVRRAGAGTAIGVVAGLLVTFSGFGHESIFEWTKYAAAGVALDVTTWALGGDLRRYGVAIAAGVAAHLAKLVAMTLLSLAAGLPLGVVAVGLGLSATTHAGFGAIGGALGAFVLRRLDKVPGLGAPR